MLSGRARLRAYLDRHKLMQTELADIIGITKAQLSHILNGVRTPGLATARRIEDATGIPMRAWTLTHDGVTDQSTDEEPVNHG